MQDWNKYQNRFYPSINRLGAGGLVFAKCPIEKITSIFLECLPHAEGTASTTPALPGNLLPVIPPTASIRYRNTVIFIITIHLVLLLLILIVLFFVTTFFVLIIRIQVVKAKRRKILSSNSWDCWRTHRLREDLWAVKPCQLGRNMLTDIRWRWWLDEVVEYVTDRTRRWPPPRRSSPSSSATSWNRSLG